MRTTIPALTLAAAVALATFAAIPYARGDADVSGQVPENVYRGQLISYPGPWAFEIGKSSIILVSDQELEELSNPDKVLNLSVTFQKREESLRQICERAKAAGQRTLIIAFDQFFKQYRPGQDQPRKLMPDMDAYIKRIAAISKFAQGYGLGLELSLLSPLEIGPAYVADTGDSGVWMHYREGLRDPKTGAFSVQLWRQQQWCNNKGPVRIKDAGVRVFAFREQAIGGTPYRVVRPQDIVEITDAAKVQVFDNLRADRGDYKAVRVRIYGQGGPSTGDLNRVLVVQEYHTPEMDYFSPNALPFLDNLIDKYAAAGVKLNGLYSDEMHIQQDWGYYNHHDDGEFCLRYVSKGLENRYAQLYGEQYRDFAKYLVYFAYGQETFTNDVNARVPTMNVMGPTPQDIQATALFRARYYHLLQDGVVDLFVAAKHHAEEKMGHKLDTRAHATWAESPTCDDWNTGRQNANRNKYEYTGNFLWSNTVQQAASACYDYFKWGDYLTGNGNDDAEGGFLDRDYLGLTLACSTGILNEVPYSYAAAWGMPGPIGQRRQNLAYTYGTAAGPWGEVEGMQHRDVDVMMLYPIDLVAEEERFGSWVTQYGYADLITPAKLLDRGKVVGDHLEIAGRTFHTLVATFEPFPSARLLDMMRALAEGGGRVIWSGPPPVLTEEGKDALATWCDLFGVDYTPGENMGQMAPGRVVSFEGKLAAVHPQTILTDFLVDHIYPVAPREGTQAVATVQGKTVGTFRALPSGGSVTFLGYRPRDDQSESLGYDVRNWFEVLTALGAYPPSGVFPGVEDNTEYLSRIGDYLFCHFPNGTVAATRHLRHLAEGWSGGFARDRKADEAYLKAHPLPPASLDFKDLKVAGHDVTYDGDGVLVFREGKGGQLVGFCGQGAKSLTVDGHETVYADHTMPLVCWTPVAKARRVPGGAVMQILIYGSGTVRIPADGLPAEVHLYAEGPTPGSKGAEVAFTREGDTLVIPHPEKSGGHWIYAVP